MTDEEFLKEVRKKVIEYYASALPFNRIAMIDVDRCERMNDEEIINEAIKLNIVKVNNPKTYRR